MLENCNIILTYLEFTAEEFNIALMDATNDNVNKDEFNQMMNETLDIVSSMEKGECALFGRISTLYAYNKENGSFERPVGYAARYPRYR